MLRMVPIPKVHRVVMPRFPPFTPFLNIRPIIGNIFVNEMFVLDDLHRKPG